MYGCSLTASVHLNKVLTLSFSCRVISTWWVTPEGELSDEAQHQAEILDQVGTGKLHAFLFRGFSIQMQLDYSCSLSSLPFPTLGSSVEVCSELSYSQPEPCSVQMWEPTQKFPTPFSSGSKVAWALCHRFMLVIPECSSPLVKQNVIEKHVLRQQTYVNFKNVLKLIVK